MGFNNGLQSCYRYLKNNGNIAITELTWLKDNPPEKPAEFFANAYPTIKNIEENLSVIEESGYRLEEYFIVPERDWRENFYVPLEKRITALRNKYMGNQDALSILDDEYEEILLYREYSEWYGYVFYIMKKE